ncbi:unnamed protein product [Ambrosiozyma monospora]|uniref:Golgi apparatus membrane protein TVP23 n=1 Tax=Ambrosiozyma monospora TaxID=43982 RepID=A0A9W6YVM7_AMBMO|nr:unnamed protein product [Ambrosiozyma monospora]
MIQPDVQQNNNFTPLQHVTPEPIATGNLANQNQQQSQSTTAASIPRTLYQRLSESSHPMALLAYLIFRIAPLLIYLFGLLFTSNYILNFIVVILLLSADFWNVKNISGRLLVGLRWWNESNELGQQVWVFETADPNRYINPIDSKCFWLFIYLSPVCWIILGIFAILKFQFLSLILVGVALALNMTNGMAYNKCDKFGKANTIASSVMGSVAGRLNPFARFF